MRESRKGQESCLKEGVKCIQIHGQCAYASYMKITFTNDGIKEIRDESAALGLT